MSAAQVPDRGTLPMDLDAEGEVLSACLTSSKQRGEVVTHLQVDDFYSRSNQVVYEAILCLETEGNTVNELQVLRWLKVEKRLNEVLGGGDYICRTLAVCTPSTAHAVVSARRVAELARVRRVTYELQVAVARAYAGVPEAGAWLADVEARIFGALHEDGGSGSPTLRPIGDLAREGYEAITERARAFKEDPTGCHLTGASTGLTGLDEILGGLLPGNLYVLGGRPGHGKTALGCQIADAVASQGKGVLFVSAEMPHAQVMDRAHAMKSGINGERIRRGDIRGDEEWSRLQLAMAYHDRLPMVVEARGVPTLSEITGAARRTPGMIKAKTGQDTELGLIVVDYLQILGAPGRHASEVERLTVLTQGHMALAKEFGVPVLLLSQLNREVEKRTNKRPMEADLRGSGSIEQDAYAIMFVYREDRHLAPGSAPTGKAEIIVSKNRNGRTGTVEAIFYPETTRFYEPLNGGGGEFDDIGEGYAA